MKKWVTFLVAVLMLASVAGCNSSIEEGASTPQEADTVKVKDESKKKQKEQKIDKVAAPTSQNPKELLPKKDNSLKNLAKGRWEPLVFLNKNTFIAEDDGKGYFVVDTKGNINNVIGRHRYIYRVSGNIIECCKENDMSDFYNVADNTKYLENVDDAYWEIQKGYIKFSYKDENGNQITQKRDTVDFSVLSDDVGEEYIIEETVNPKSITPPASMEGRKIISRIGEYGFFAENDDLTLSIYDAQGNPSEIKFPAGYKIEERSLDNYVFVKGPGEFDESYYYDLNTNKLLRTFKSGGVIMYNSKYNYKVVKPMNIVHFGNKFGEGAHYSKDMTHFISGYIVGHQIEYQETPTPEICKEVILYRDVPCEEIRYIREYVYLDLENWKAEVLCKIESPYFN